MDPKISNPQTPLENNQPISQQPPQTPPSSETKKKNIYQIIISVLVAILVIAGIGGGYYYYTLTQNTEESTAQEQTQPSEATTEQSMASSSSKMNVESVFTSVSSAYGGSLPWENVNNKMSYQFYPNGIKDLTVATGEISEHYDDQYNAITSMSIGEDSTVPVRSAYLGYYEIPDAVKQNYNLETMDIVFPIRVVVYEFDRPITQAELSIIETPEFLKCKNENADISQSIHTDNRVVASYCNLNLTQTQSEQLAEGDYKDVFYIIYFKERNLLVEMGLDSRYAKDTNAYISDYLSKLFNSNTSLTINQNQIQSIQEAREFSEWRKRTFEK